MKSYQIPFDRDGNLMHFARTEPGSYYHAHEWRNVRPLQLILTLDSLRTGRSAKYTIWKDLEGHEYPMFITDVMDIIKRGNLAEGTCAGVFEGVKRGQNYGLRLCG